MSDVPDAQAAQASGVTEDSIKQKLVEKLEATHVEVKDVSGIYSLAPLNFGHQSHGHELELILSIGGCGQMFEAIIVSPQFAKKMTLARHRLVNTTLKQEIAAIHAWTPKCLTPEEWEKRKGELSL